MSIRLQLVPLARIPNDSTRNVLPADADWRTGYETVEMGARMGNDHVAEHVRRYYECVDAGQVDQLLDLFRPNAVYNRPGYPPMEGRAAMEAFYRGERVISAGAHTLDRLTVDETGAAVHGQFTGVLKDGREVSLRFADFFVVGEDGLFARRDTFFFAPMV
jgi:ketosteroid isomerase-like protein